MKARKKNDGAPRPAAPGAMPDAEEIRRRTAEKAYDLYLRRDCVPGRELEDWLEAERLVRQEVEPPARRAPGRRPRSTA